MYAQPQEGNSPLYKAAEKGDARAVELLLMHKADPCAQNNVRMFTNAWNGRGWDGGEGGGRFGREVAKNVCVFASYRLGANRLSFLFARISVYAVPGWTTPRSSLSFSAIILAPVVILFCSLDAHCPTQMCYMDEQAA